MCCCGDLGFRSSAMFGHRSAGFLLLPSSLQTRRGSDASSGIALPRLVVSSSMGSVVGAGNAIAFAAAAAAAGGTGAAHSAVSSAIAHVAVTAVAIASGACLSTKVDFLWPKVEKQPDSLVVEGVDVSGFPIFNDTKPHTIQKMRAELAIM